MSKVYAIEPDFDKGETLSPFGRYCRVFLVCRTTGNQFFIKDGKHAGTEQEHQFTHAVKIEFDDDTATTEGMATVTGLVSCRQPGQELGPDELVGIVRNHDCSGLVHMTFRHYVRLKPMIAETITYDGSDFIEPVFVESAA